jgi:signal transduction histidine kinase
VAHELRNPLATVRNAATYIGRRVGEAPAGAPAGAADPRVAQFLGVIDRELDACARIIGDLLDFARERPPKRQACPLAPLVDEAISVLPASRARVRNDVPWDLPVPALDREQLRQVLINLLQNAVEALPPERADSEVVVRAEGGGERPWRLSVHDCGSGIPVDALSKVFEPLFTTKLKGTGLGLAVVANLVRGHGGTIRVESEEGRGTTFIIELPAGEGVAAA